MSNSVLSILSVQFTVSLVFIVVFLVAPIGITNTSRWFSDCFINFWKQQFYLSMYYVQL